MTDYPLSIYPVHPGLPVRDHHEFVAAFDEIPHQSGPPGLVGSAQPESGFPIKVFMKQPQIAPFGIILKRTVPGKSWDKPFAVSAKYVDKIFGDTINHS